MYYIGGRIVRDTSSGSECPDGQEVKGQVSRRIDIFDMTARNWITENLPQLNEARKDFQRCVCDGYIYIVSLHRGSKVFCFGKTVLDINLLCNSFLDRRMPN